MSEDRPIYVVQYFTMTNPVKWTEIGYFFDKKYAIMLVDTINLLNENCKARYYLTCGRIVETEEWNKIES